MVVVVVTLLVGFFVLGTVEVVTRFDGFRVLVEDDDDGRDVGFFVLGFLVLVVVLVFAGGRLVVCFCELGLPGDVVVVRCGFDVVAPFCGFADEVSFFF